jgi:hypothetical protein
MTDVAGRHGWKESLRASAIQWMRRWLAGDETVPEIDVADVRKLDEGFNLAKVDHGLEGKASNVTPDGRVDKLSGFKSIFEYLKEDLSAAEAARSASAPYRTKVVCRRAGIRPLEQVGVSVKEVGAPQRLPDGFTILREIYSFSDGQKVPAVTFLPKGALKGAVLVVDDRADRGIHRMRVTQTLAEGKAITVADLAGIGETGAMYRRTWQGTDTPDEVPAMMLYMLGKSMVGVRAEEMIALADAQRRRLGLKTEIVAHGNAAIAAAHAYAARRDLFASIYCCHTPPSWADSVRKGTFIPFANVVNGALLDYDWTDLLCNGKK